MSTETASSLPDPSPLLRLRQSLQACAQPFDDAAESGEAVAAVVEILDSIGQVPQSENEVPRSGDENCTVSEQALREVYQFLSTSPSKQMVIDTLSMDLPRVVCRMGALSDKCHQVAESIMELLVCSCNPRDMISILCEALDADIEEPKAPLYYLLLVNGLAQVLTLIRRRHLEQVKVTIPIVLNVLYKMSLLPVEEEHNKSITDLFEAAIRIGGSIQEMCKNMDGGRKEELCAVLGLYLLHNIALISKSREKILNCSLVVLDVSKLLPFCGFSYFGLVTGLDVTTAFDRVSKEEDDDFARCLSLSKDGAGLTVVWGHINGDIANSVGEELEVVVKEIQNNWVAMWQAVGMLKYPLSSTSYDWEIKEHALEILSTVLDGSSLDEFNDQNLDVSTFVPCIFTTLQAIQKVMMGAMDASLRKKAFVVLKKIILVIPSADRFDILKALITDSMSPSMKALLMDIVREQTAGQYQKDAKSYENLHGQHIKENFSWSVSSLELVEIVLRPPEGGPPSFPDDSEPVLSALNLVRFLLLKESTGQSNGTKVMTQQVLQKIYSEWLLPLRTLVTGIKADNENGSSEFADHLSCGLNPVLLVLYHCIELVEEAMKRF